MGNLTTDQPDGSVVDIDSLNLAAPLRIIVAPAKSGVLAYMTLNVADLSVIFAPAPNSIVGLSVLAGVFALSGDPAFTLSSNGIVTYTGNDQDVLVTCTASLSTTGLTGVVYLGVALDNDLVAQVASPFNLTLVQAGCSSASAEAGGTVASLAARRRLALSAGNFLRPVAGTENTVGASDITVLYMQLTVEPAA